MAIVCPACGRQYDVTLFQFGASVACDCGERVDPFPMNEAVEMPIDGTLDLHTFAPSDVRELVPEYLRLCREKGITRIRIVHGKGDGSLLRTVHALLRGIPEVDAFESAGPAEGGWGATIVKIRGQDTHSPNKSGESKGE
jgi:dsDNA-specific endonuclease/ATPase MutS2